MAFCQLNFNNKTIIIFITSIVWAINFRTTFKNIDSHMDSGSYASLKFDPKLIFMKNILNCFFFIGLLLEIKQVKATPKSKKELVKIQTGNTIVVELKEKKDSDDNILKSFSKMRQLNNKTSKILFWLKNIFIIIIIYISEELYFIISNNHILDRIVCPIRNLGFLISFLIFSPLLLRKSQVLYRHQLFPLIIIFILSLFMIFFNKLKIDRFNKLFGLNLVYYLVSFILIGLESVLLKYLVDIQYINIFLILGIKGIIGTITSGIICIKYRKIEFFNFIDNILIFEYEDMYIKFPIYQKIGYIISSIILQYLIINIVSLFTSSHLLSVLMITDIIYFPFYCFERFKLQKFNISNLTSFYVNIILGFINVLLMLIFNELLECKFCGLGANLEKNIIKRQKEDYLTSFRNYHNNSSGRVTLQNNPYNSSGRVSSQNKNNHYNSYGRISSQNNKNNSSGKVTSNEAKDIKSDEPYDN